MATLGWSDQDHALALGVVPVGATKLTWGGNDAGSSDWFDAALEEAGGEAPVRYDDADGAPVVEIAKLDPDLILATNSGITEQEYEKLSKIAPVVAYPEAPWITPWQTSLEMVGKALGRTEPRRGGHREHRAGDRRRQARATRSSSATSMIFGYLTTTDLSTVGIYAPEDPRVSFMHDLGLVDAPAVAGAIKPGEFYGSVSAEQASALDSDVFLTWSENPGDLETFSDNKLIGQIPALAVGQRLRRGGQARQPRGHQPDAALDPVRHRAVRARGGQGRRRLVTTIPATAQRPGRPGHRTRPGAGHRRHRHSWPWRRWWSSRCRSSSVPERSRCRPSSTPPTRCTRCTAARIDRTLLGLAVGAALGLAGACMQGLTRNPLADPGILGINAGASFAMVLAISLFGVSDLGDYLWFAFLGAAVAAVLVHAIASLGRDGATPLKLAIAGAALTAAVSSWTSGILLVDRKTMETFRFWQVGTVGGRDLEVLTDRPAVPRRSAPCSR